MAINIKDPATDELARRLVAATGESITVAVRVSMEERLTRVQRQQRLSTGAERLIRYIARARRRRLLDERPAEEILGYDESGLPR